MIKIKFFFVKLILATLFLGLTMLQVFSFPGQFRNMRRTQDIDLVFEIALTLLFGLWLLCGQMALIYLWRIVGFMKYSNFFSVPTLKWLNRLVLAFWIACAIPVILFTLIAPQADDPGFLVLLFVVTLFLFSLTAITSLLRDQIKGKIE